VGFLQQIKAGGVMQRTRNPDYVAPAEGEAPAANAPPKILERFVPFTDDQVRFKKFEITEICRPLSQSLTR
jgi:hypothetical protein